MLQGLQLPAVVVDIETTGGNVTRDRIIEIGIVEITATGIHEWSTLINPRQTITSTIERITGISNAMVEQAPYFENIAKTLVERLEGRLFIAHNVRFDYGFIRNEFARLGYPFKASLMCTVKLSRALYKDADGHSLEKIIRRHQIFVTERHRALADARATYQFICIAEEEQGAAAVKAAISGQGKRSSLPLHISSEMINQLPRGPGVYYFWGEGGELLYVGKSVTVRKRVMSHFTADYQSSKEMRLAQSTRTITADTTTGELSALILESRQIKALQPLFNRRLRRSHFLYSLRLAADTQGLLIPTAVKLDAADAPTDTRFGLFTSASAAKTRLKEVCAAHQLCYQAVGLEATGTRPCTGFQIKRCRGWCAGQESTLEHNARLVAALSELALTAWPFAGPIAIVETDAAGDYAHILVHHWRVLGIARDACEQQALLERASAEPLDKDIYRYLVSFIMNPRRRHKIIPLLQALPKDSPEADDASD